MNISFTPPHVKYFDWLVLRPGSYVHSALQIRGQQPTFVQEKRARHWVEYSDSEKGSFSTSLDARFPYWSTFLIFCLFLIPSRLPESGFKRTTEVLVTMGSHSISRDSHQGILFLVYIPCETTVYFRLFGERTVEALGTLFLTGCYRRFLMIMDSKRGEKLEVVCSEMVLKHLRLIRPRTSPTEWQRKRVSQSLAGTVKNCSDQTMIGRPSATLQMYEITMMIMTTTRTMMAVIIDYHGQWETPAIEAQPSNNTIDYWVHELWAMTCRDLWKTIPVFSGPIISSFSVVNTPDKEPNTLRDLSPCFIVDVTKIQCWKLNDRKTWYRRILTRPCFHVLDLDRCVALIYTGHDDRNPSQSW